MSEHPDTHGDARVLARTAEETRGLAPPLVLLFGATAILLVIACGNIATLSMAEMLNRQHEIATRSALGAGATRIMRLLLTESFVLAALGSAVGAALAFGGTRVLVTLGPPIPRLHEVGVDLRILGFAALLGTCAAFLFGTAPSIVASRNTRGGVKDPRVLKGHPLLDAAALQAVRQWRYIPALMNGEPWPVEVGITLVLQLKQ